MGSRQDNANGQSHPGSPVAKGLDFEHADADPARPQALFSQTFEPN